MPEWRSGKELSTPRYIIQRRKLRNGMGLIVYKGKEETDDDAAVF